MAKLKITSLTFRLKIKLFLRNLRFTRSKIIIEKDKKLFDGGESRDPFYAPPKPDSNCPEETPVFNNNIFYKKQTGFFTPEFFRIHFESFL